MLEFRDDAAIEQVRMLWTLYLEIRSYIYTLAHVVAKDVVSQAQ